LTRWHNLKSEKLLDATFRIKLYKGNFILYNPKKMSNKLS
jgi:hypothetical protein